MTRLKNCISCVSIPCGNTLLQGKSGASHRVTLITKRLHFSMLLKTVVFAFWIAQMTNIQVFAVFMLASDLVVLLLCRWFDKDRQCKDLLIARDDAWMMVAIMIVSCFRDRRTLRMMIVHGLQGLMVVGAVQSIVWASRHPEARTSEPAFLCYFSLFFDWLLFTISVFVVTEDQALLP